MDATILLPVCVRGFHFDRSPSSPPISAVERMQIDWQSVIVEQVWNQSDFW